MPLDQFNVVLQHFEPLDRVLIRCFDGRQRVYVFITQQDIDDYFHRRDLDSHDGDRLMHQNLELLIPVIRAKYEARVFSTFRDPYSGLRSPRIDLTLTDLPEGMSDDILDEASFQRG
jgi:hypothetical protein